MSLNHGNNTAVRSSEVGELLDGASSTVQAALADWNIPHDVELEPVQSVCARSAGGARYGTRGAGISGHRAKPPYAPVHHHLCGLMMFGCVIATAPMKCDTAQGLLQFGGRGAMRQCPEGDLEEAVL